MDRVKIVLADDMRIFREGIRTMLERREDFEVVGEAADGEEAVRVCAELTPDVLVTELLLPRLSGLSAIDRLRTESERTRCIVLSTRQGRSWLEAALRSGATAYVPKDSPSEELERAIDSATAGKFYFSPSVNEYVVDAIAGPGESSDCGVSLLTKREREVLQLIAEGLSTKEIAVQLGVSPKTAETHRAGLMEKVGIHKSAALVRFAIREGLVAP